jgi:hypothetical protein
LVLGILVLVLLVITSMSDSLPGSTMYLF